MVGADVTLEFGPELGLQPGLEVSWDRVGAGGGARGMTGLGQRWGLGRVGKATEVEARVGAGVGPGLGWETGLTLGRRLGIRCRG